MFLLLEDPEPLWEFSDHQGPTQGKKSTDDYSSNILLMNDIRGFQAFFGPWYLLDMRYPTTFL